MKLKDLIPKYNNGGWTEDRIQKVIDKYGRGKSPMEAWMYVEVSKQTGVPIDLLLAQGIQESSLGTAGMAVRTKNVGNVGNHFGKMETNRDSWFEGLRVQAKLLRDEYFATSPTNIQNLINTNFTRPKKGGQYAPTDPNYGSKIARTINLLNNTTSYSSNKSGNNTVNSPTTNTSNGSNDGPKSVDNLVSENPREYVPIYSEEDKKRLNDAIQKGFVDFGKFKELSATSPMIFNMLDHGSMKWLEDNKKIEEEMNLKKAEQERVDQFNKSVLKQLEDKEQTKKQILSMVPIATYSGHGTFRDGGMLGGLDRDVIGFYQELKSLFPNLRVTSGFRKNARTSNGSLSRHAVGQAIDLAPDNHLHRWLYSAEGDALMRKYSLGLLDETIASNLAKTKGSGAHFHIGKDFKGNSSKLNTAFERRSSLTNNASTFGGNVYNKNGEKTIWTGGYINTGNNMWKGPYIGDNSAVFLPHITFGNSNGIRSMDDIIRNLVSGKGDSSNVDSVDNINSSSSQTEFASRLSTLYLNKLKFLNSIPEAVYTKTI